VTTQNGQAQPPANPEPKTPKTPYVISDEVKADFVEEVKKHFADNPNLEIAVPTIKEVIAAKYEPDVAEKMVAQLQFKADVLAELKAEAAANAPSSAPPKPGEKIPFRVLSPIGYDGKDYAPGKEIKLTQKEADEMPWALEAIKENKEK
jgi:hypothetical protein